MFRGPKVFYVIKIHILLPRKTGTRFFSLTPHIQHGRTVKRSGVLIQSRPLFGRECKSALCIKPRCICQIANMASSAQSDRDTLPDTIKPVHYGLSLYDLELGGAFSYQGSVNIVAKIIKSSKEITLNSHQLKIHSAEVSVKHTKTQQSMKSIGISYDAPKQRATLTFAEELPISDKATIIVQFQGM